MEEERTNAALRIRSLEKEVADAEIGNFGLLDQRDAEQRKAAALRKELDELRVRNEELARGDMELLRRNVADLKRIRVQQDGKLQKLAAELQALKQVDRDAAAGVERLQTRHEAELGAQRARTTALEARLAVDRDIRIRAETAIAQGDVLRRKVDLLV